MGREREDEGQTKREHFTELLALGCGRGGSAGDPRDSTDPCPRARGRDDCPGERGRRLCIKPTRPAPEHFNSTRVNLTAVEKVDREIGAVYGEFPHVIASPFDNGYAAMAYYRQVGEAASLPEAFASPCGAEKGRHGGERAGQRDTGQRGKRPTSGWTLQPPGRGLRVAEAVV